MPTTIVKAFVSTALIAALGAIAFGQATSSVASRFVISAEAGGVNYTQGAVAIARRAGRSGLLLKGDQIAVGDRVSTGDDGRAEILLNPGSYLRLDKNSAFEFKNTSLANLQLRLDRGDAILEVYAAREFRVTIYTPKGRVLLAKSGVYRLNVDDNTLAVEAWEGDAILQDAHAAIVKEGRRGTVRNGQATIEKLGGSDKDDFTAWSRSRSKQLAKETASLKNKSVRDTFRNSLLGSAFNYDSSFGLWVLNPYTNQYCFLPFAGGWTSPYGFGFDNYLGYYGWPWNDPWYHPWYPSYPRNPGTGGGGGGGGSTGGGGTTSSGVATSGDRSVVPPFVRMGGTGDSSTRGRGRGISNSDDNFPTRNAPPIFIPSAPPPPPPSAPARVPGGKKG